MNTSIYQADIIDQAKNPLNFNKKIVCDINSQHKNASCGDEIYVELKIDKQKVVDISWKGQGCTISMAAMSMLSEYIKNKSLAEIKNYNLKTINFLFDHEINFGRIKCATLGLQSIQKAIKKYEQK